MCLQLHTTYTPYFKQHGIAFLLCGTQAHDMVRKSSRDPGSSPTPRPPLARSPTLTRYCFRDESRYETMLADEVKQINGGGGADAGVRRKRTRCRLWGTGVDTWRWYFCRVVDCFGVGVKKQCTCASIVSVVWLYTEGPSWRYCLFFVKKPPPLNPRR